MCAVGLAASPSAGPEMRCRSPHFYTFDSGPTAATHRSSPARIGSQTSSSSAESDLSSLVDLERTYASLCASSKEPGQIHRVGRWRLDHIREAMVRLHAEHLAEHRRFSAKGREVLLTPLTQSDCNATPSR